MEQQITFRPFHHAGGEQLGIYFNYAKAVDYAIRSLRGIRWTQTHKCWYLPLSKASFQIAFDKLKDFGKIEYGEVTKYLDNKKMPVTINQAITAPVKATKNSRVTAASSRINEPNLELLDKTLKTLQLKAYATNTIDLYCSELLQLMRLLRDRSLAT